MRAAHAFLLAAVLVTGQSARRCFWARRRRSRWHSAFEQN
jgi:hypothetical protein